MLSGAGSEGPGYLGPFLWKWGEEGGPFEGVTVYGGKASGPGRCQCCPDVGSFYDKTVRRGASHGLTSKTYAGIIAGGCSVARSSVHVGLVYTRTMDYQSTGRLATTKTTDLEVSHVLLPFVERGPCCATRSLWS